MSALGRASGWLGQVLAWCFVIATAGVLAVTVLVPRLGGATPYTVLTSSMEPGMPPGTLIVVKPVGPDELGVGTVITYQLESGQAPVVTHRVVAVETAINGERTFVTQGDANDAPDPEPVRPVQIRGRLWYDVPHLGHVNALLTGAQRQLVVYGVAALLLGYAAFMFATGFRGRRAAPVAPRGSEGPSGADALALDADEGVRIDG